ncbi:MAG: metallophosphoesterase [Candidatus Kapaibacterium sp.]
MFIWIIIALFILAFFYLGRRFIRTTSLAPRTKRLLWIGLYAWGAIIIACVILSRSLESWSSALSWIGYPSLGLLSSLFFLLLLRDIIWGSSRGIAWLRARFSKGERQESTVDKVRRAHLLQITNLGVIGLATTVTAYGAFEARRRPGIVQISVPIERLPKEFAGFRIVQITDLHAGLTVGREWIETVVEEVRALKPDMIAFTGDIADGSVPHLRDAVAPLAGLSAPYGKFFITGNHEYYSGVEAWVAEVRRLGYDVLLNEHRIIQRDGASIVLGGVTDYTGGKYLPSHTSDPVAAFRDAPEGLVRIFLAHQPKTLKLTDSVQFDLMLSGHTHGGQFFPWNLATTLDQPYLSGLHRPDGKWIYVSKGTGYWGPPVRLGARSEITVVTLTGGNAA